MELGIVARPRSNSTWAANWQWAFGSWQNASVYSISAVPTGNKLMKGKSQTQPIKGCRKISDFKKSTDPRPRQLTLLGL